MMTLYFSPGACSLASHIGLEETGAPYEAKLILLAKKQQLTEEYLKINPRGKVPALSVDGRVLVENTAILTYLARRFPEKKLMPADPFEEARCISTMCWFSSVVHPSFQRCNRPERFAESEVAYEAIKANGRKSFWANLQEIDAMFKGNDWIMGPQYTVVDPYALVFYGWGLRGQFPMHELRAYTAWRERMMNRPTVRKIVEEEQKLAA
ncbi:MAG TPA: glutathione S-transferase family protein [candidate division Zixibacteria bacterium]|nr:glutathione S-transferase family protein [candidate division Zixibacteria bacterium]